MQQDVTLQDLLQMVKRLVEDQASTKKELIARVDLAERHLDGRIKRLEERVIGNGDERALLVRVRDNERVISNTNQQLSEIVKAVRSLQETQNAWRNRAIGIMIALPILTTLLVFILARILPEILSGLP